MSPRLRASLVALVLTACRLPPKGGDTTDPSVNVCLSDETCGAEGVCRSGLCQATDVRSDVDVVFLITRSQVSGASNVQPVLAQGEAGSSWKLGDLARDGLSKLSIPPLATVDVSLTNTKNNPSTERGCFPVDDQAVDLTLPMNVTLRPAASLRGLGLATYGRRASDPRTSKPADATSLHAQLAVPPATYDAYVVPDVSASCPLPPILMRGLTPTSGRVTTFTIDLKSLQSSALGATLTTSASLDLAGWTARLVDASTGLTVSTVVTFYHSSPTTWTFGALAQDTNLVSSTRIEFYPQINLATDKPSPSSVFLVMEPPGDGAPRLAWDMAALDTFDRNNLSLDLTSLSLEPVEVELRTERGDDPLGQLSSVWLTSESTPGSLVGAPAGALAFFSAGPVTTDASGVARLSLLPGSYRARGVPINSLEFGLGDRSFTFLPRADGGTLTGFALPLPRLESLDVAILPPNGESPLTDVPFEITPSLATGTLAERVFGAPSPRPRASSGRTSADGHMLARVDVPRPGTLVDMTLRLPIDRGFPWLVKPAVSLPFADTADASPLSLRLSLPVVVQGVASDPLVGDEKQRPLSGARLQAFALLPGGTYVPIADGLIGEDDDYRLLLPSSL